MITSYDLLNTFVDAAQSSALRLGTHRDDGAAGHMTEGVSDRLDDAPSGHKRSRIDAQDSTTHRDAARRTVRGIRHQLAFSRYSLGISKFAETFCTSS